MEEKRLFLLDAFALIYRAYFAFSKRPLINSKGFNVSAASGFTSTLYELLNKEKPTHIAVVFDAPGATNRAQEFDFYKANREAMPEDIASNLDYIRQIIAGFNIPTYELAGYEADDIIGTIAKQKAKEGFTVYMVTPDKDFAQLVEENIYMYKPARSGKGVEILGLPEIKEKWGIEHPDQVIDILGMWGDAVDNIPGIPGVGEKTAKKFIQQFGSMEGLFQNTDQLKGKIKEKVEANIEQGRISKALATIIIDAPIQVDDKDLIREPINTDKLGDLFAELEFRTLGRKIIGSTFSVNTSGPDLFNQTAAAAVNIPQAASTEGGKNIENVDHEYQLITTAEELKLYCDELLKQPMFVFDTETTGLDFGTLEIIGVALSYEANKAAFVKLPDNEADKAALLKILQPVLNHQTIIKCAHNIKYDTRVLNLYGIEVSGPIFDTMVAHYLLDPDGRHKMDILSEQYLGYTPIAIESLIGKKGKNQLKLTDVADEKLRDYACEDADITFQLYQKIQPQLSEHQLEELYQTISNPLIPVLAAMENEGVALDLPFLEQYSITLAEEIKDLEEKIFSAAGVQFNLNSPSQMGEVLFDKMAIPYKGKKTKTGQYSTNEETLTKLKADHPIVADILEYREIAKLKSTYVDALPNEINARTGRVHTTFNQTIASTGRLSSIGPNLQNIPIKSDRGKRVRKAFIPRNEDYVLMAADYSQIELRLIAAICKEENMLEAFNSGVDFHSSTAAKVYGVDIDEVTNTQRRNAKTVNFSITYGAGAFRLSQTLGIPRKEAADLIDDYFAAYPGLKRFMDETVEQAKMKGYVETLKGRKRYLAGINSKNYTVRSAAEREAINAPIQGTAADLIKIAMINIHKVFKTENLKSKMTLQVHDELVFDVYKPELEKVKEIVKREMESAMEIDVPILVEVGVGQNWLEAH